MPHCLTSGYWTVDLRGRVDEMPELEHRKECQYSTQGRLLGVPEPEGYAVIGSERGDLT